MKRSPSDLTSVIAWRAATTSADAAWTSAPSVWRRFFASALLVFALILGYVPASQAQVAQLGTSTSLYQSTAGASHSLGSVTVPAGSNRVLIVTASHAGFQDVASVSFGGTPMIKAIERDDGSVAVDSIWFLVLGSAPGSTAGTVVAQFATPTTTTPTPPRESFLAAATFSGVDQGTPVSASNSTNDTGVGGPNLGSSLTLASAAGDLVLDVFDGFRSTGSVTPNVVAGQTLLASGSGAITGTSPGQVGYRVSTKPGAAPNVTVGWTSNSEAMIHVAVNLRASASAPASAPTVSSPTSTAVTSTNATLGGNVTADGGASISARGVVLSPTATNNNPLIGGSGVINLTTAGTTGVFTLNATSLTPNTAYSFKAYATNSAGTGYSSIGTFATPCPATVVTNGNDSGAGSLRQIIADACPGSTITFAPGVNTVTLTTAVLFSQNTLTIDGGANRVTITRSTAPGTPDFGVIYFQISTLTLSNLIISNGRSSDFGGGVYVNAGNLIINDSIIRGNTVLGAQGGGIAVVGGTLTMNRTLVEGNQGVAAGIYVQDSAAVISGSTIRDNSGSGAGIRFTTGGNQTFQLISSTISDNVSPGGESALLINSGGSSILAATVINSTITRNVTTAAGGSAIISTVGNISLSLTNSIVSGNLSGGVAADSQLAFAPSSTNNLIGVGGGLTNGANGNIVGVTNPRVSASGDFGGPVPTVALLPGSPAINAGSGCVLTANGCSNSNPALLTDQRGTARVGAVDIGAFESRGFTLTPSGGSGQSTFINTGFANPLVVSVAPVAAGEPVAGGVVRYTAPGSGASASLGSADAVIDALGTASSTASANGTPGGYTVSANANGSTAGVSFALTNLATPTVSVAPTTLSVNEAGETSDSFLVSLSAAPTSNVTIQLAFDANVQVDAGSGFGASPQTVTLTPANALSGVTVTVRAVDDAVVEASPHFSTITTAATASAQAVFNGLAVPDVTVSITDNDTAGISVIESGGSTAVTEGGATDSYTVVLGSQPTANVSVALSFDAAQININGNSSGSLDLVFTPGNWNTVQVLTVSAVDDTLVEANPHTSTIVQTASSTDPLYAAINPADVTVSITDNESATVALVGTASNAAETAGTASLSAQLQLLSNGVPGGTLAVPVAAQVVLTPGSAEAGSDYTPSTVSVSFASGTAHNATRPIDVGVVNDRLLEGAESFTVSLAPVGSIGSVSGSHVVTLLDDETGVFSFTAPTASVPEAAGPYTGAAQLLISGSGEGSVFRIQNAASVALSATPGSASSPADYNLLTTLLEVPANAASLVALSVQVAIVDDAIDEANETFTLGFGAVSGSGALSATGSQVVTIVDDDLAGVTVTQSGGSTAVTEGGATDTYTLVLTSQPTADVTVALAGGTQLTTAPISVSFTTMNWATPQTVTVTAVDDAVVEGTHNGSVTHTVTSADAAYDGLLVDTVSVTITDNDTAGVTVTESDGSTAVTEGGATDAISVVLTSQPVADVTVTVTTGTQLSVNTNPLVFTAANWNVAQVVTVSAEDDNVVEGPHSGTLSFAVTSADPAYAAIPLAPITVAITDNDSAVVSFSPISVSQSEATSPMVFTVALSAPVASGVTLTVNSANGTALAPADYTAITAQTVTFAANSTTPQTVSVAINNDALFEADEAFTLTLSNLVATGNVTLGSAMATGTIVNDDAAPTITINAPSVNEGNAGTTPMNFVVSLSAASGLPVNFSFATGTGTATAGADYTAIPSTPGSIAAGSTSLTIPVSVLGDTTSEANETVVLNLTGISNANVSSLSGIGTILDDDVAQIRIEDAGLTEGDSGSQNLSFTVTRSDNGGAFSVNYATANGTAIAGSDYTASSGTLNFSSGGALSQTLEVPITGDLLVEATESFTVTLSAVVNSVGTAAIDRATATGTITDNDSAVVSFAPASVSQSEATSPMVFTVTLTNPVASGVIVKVNSTNGTATAGADYTAVVDQTVTFAPNSTTAQTVNVAVTNDALDEDNETYTLTLSALSATGDVTLGAATATGTIEDDDALPTLSVANVTQPEGNAVNTLTFTVNLSPVSGRAVSFTRATVDGSAVSTGLTPDFVAIPAGPITIPAGQTSVEIPVTINGDTVFEGDEQFTLSLTDIANANIGGATIAGTATSLSATATLQDDDQQPTTTTITADLPDPSVVGQSYPVTVEVRAQTLSPLGTVSITDGTGASCNAPLVAGTAPLSAMTCTLTSTSAGNKTLTASYTPASSAFAESSDTEAHTVNAAATTLVLLGPARARIGTVATYTAEISVTAPGAGTPAGTVTVTAGANSCTITLPTATPSCTITYSSLGSRSVSAVFAASNGDFVGSTATPVQTLVFASADISVTKTNGVHTYRPGDLLVYTVVVRNDGPDAAPQVRIRDVAPAGLTNVAWTCVSSGGAVCPDAGGTGTLDHVVETLPSNGVLTYAYFGNVVGRPLSIVNVAEVSLPVDTTIEDPNAANNSATDTDLLDDLFADGFEAPGINAESGGVRLAGASLRSTLDEVARVTVRLGDVRGEALRVYARVIGGELQVALAVRGAEGALRLGAWQRTSGEPELVWTATPAAGGFVLSGASLR